VTDLYWLNDLELARCVCRLPVPVFTGIGHERDNTILDEVAHRRCDTPSKVIGWISGTVYANANAAIENLLSILKTAGDAIVIHDRSLELLRREVEASGKQLLTTAQHDLERFIDQIRHQSQSRILGVEHELARYLEAIRHASHRQIGELDQGIEYLRNLIAHLGVQRLGEAEQAIEFLAREILGLGPQATLKRGFALVRARRAAPSRPQRPPGKSGISSSNSTTGRYRPA